MPGTLRFVKLEQYTRAVLTSHCPEFALQFLIKRASSREFQEFPRMNAVYERVFAGHRPARTTVQVSALPEPGLRVEIDCIAYVP
ncbi:RidA family protein [Cystobacter fuscus]|uniref:RidA family protein n=1 Tax=Cystobacter fuscus TaxID=43 RepID=UPI0037BF1C5B